MRQIRLYHEQALRLSAEHRAARCLDVNLQGKHAEHHIKALEAFAHGKQ